MVIAIPSLFNVVKGWHARPGKETVSITLLLQRDRSPSGTGRAFVYGTKRRNVASTRLANADPINDTTASSLGSYGMTPAGEVRIEPKGTRL